MRYCEINGCDTKHYVHGWCQKHYERWRRHGDPLKLVYNLNPVTWKYLLSCSRANNKTRCIEWQKGRHPAGYGIIRFRNNDWSTHRVSWVLNNGEIPTGLHVCHQCDNPPCINPDHLFLGTMADNMRDMANKGRAKRGEQHHWVKLTEKDVLAIRKMSGLRIEIAKKFNVCPANITAIKKRRSWAWLK